MIHRRPQKCSIKKHLHRGGAGVSLLVCYLFVAFAADEENELGGFEGQVDDVANAEGDDEVLGRGDMGECPET